MAEVIKCRQCRFLKQTSSTQVFRLCKYWSKSGNGQGWNRSYVETMCHRQPEAPACPFFEPILEYDVEAL